MMWWTRFPTPKCPQSRPFSAYPSETKVHLQDNVFRFSYLKNPASTNPVQSGPRNHLAPRVYLLHIPPPGDMRVTSRTLAALSFSDLQKLRPHFVQYRTIKETLHKELLFKLAHKPPYRSDRKYPRHYHYQLGWQGFNFC